MNSSEVTPTVWNITRSTNSPIAKPAIAPAIEPASRPIDITTSGVTSAVTPNSEIWETNATWITTAKKPTTAIRRLSWMVLSVFIAAGVPEAPSVGVRVGQDLHEAQMLEVDERRDRHLLSW